MQLPWGEGIWTAKRDLSNCFYLWEVEPSRLERQVIGPRIPRSWLHDVENEAEDRPLRRPPLATGLLGFLSRSWRRPRAAPTATTPLSPVLLLLFGLLRGPRCSLGGCLAADRPAPSLTSSSRVRPLVHDVPHREHCDRDEKQPVLQTRSAPAPAEPPHTGRVPRLPKSVTIISEGPARSSAQVVIWRDAPRATGLALSSIALAALHRGPRGHGVPEWQCGAGQARGPTSQAAPAGSIGLLPKGRPPRRGQR